MKEKSIFMSILVVAALVAFWAFPGAETATGAVSDDTIGRPTPVTGTVTVTGTVAVSNLAAGQVQTDAMATGYIGSQSVEVGTSVKVQVGTLTAGTKIMRITTSGDLNYGGSWVNTGTGFACMTATASPYDFKVSTTTPVMYLEGKSASVSVLIEHIK